VIAPAASSASGLALACRYLRGAAAEPFLHAAELDCTRGRRAVDKGLSARFTVPRTGKKGTYRFTVYAKDKAGNTQTSPVGANKLGVK
jgi:hypothetical protein